MLKINAKLGKILKLETKRVCLLRCHFMLLKMIIILPRQARDKHRERALIEKRVFVFVFLTTAGGINLTLVENLPKFEQPTMIFGADVTHPVRS